MVKKKLNFVETIKSDYQYTFIVDTTIYPSDAVFQTAYIFTNLAYVKLDGDPAKKIEISLKLKDGSKINYNLESEFFNELLNHTLIEIINYKNSFIKENIVSKALVSASGDTEYDDILKDLANTADIDADLEQIDQELAELEKQFEAENKLNKKNGNKD